MLADCLGLIKAKLMDQMAEKRSCFNEKSGSLEAQSIKRREMQWQWGRKCDVDYRKRYDGWLIARA
jgi:hypothetical protein